MARCSSSLNDHGPNTIMHRSLAWEWKQIYADSLYSIILGPYKPAKQGRHSHDDLAGD